MKLGSFEVFVHKDEMTGLESLMIHTGTATTIHLKPIPGDSKAENANGILECWNGDATVGTPQGYKLIQF